MHETRGPRLISHLPDEEDPTYDPRVEAAFALHLEGRRRASELEVIHAAILRGEVGLDDLPAVYKVLGEHMAWYAIAKAQEPTVEAQARAWAEELPEELRRVRLEYIELSERDPRARKLLPVAVQGSTQKGAQLGYFKSPLAGGKFGYLQRRADDCLRAALASCVQAPMPEVPELKPDQLRAAGKDPEEIGRVVEFVLGTWMDKHALTVVVHPARLPVTSRCWIGITHNLGSHGADGTHCVLMQGRQPVFDTAWLVPPGEDLPVSWWGLDDIELGLTIERR